jgi:hypothetical protein
MMALTDLNFQGCGDLEVRREGGDADGVVHHAAIIPSIVVTHDRDDEEPADDERALTRLYVSH